jgi:hypothetical protein
MKDYLNIAKSDQAYVTEGLSIRAIDTTELFIRKLIGASYTIGNTTYLDAPLVIHGWTNPKKDEKKRS